MEEEKKCTHLGEIVADVVAKTPEGCEECLKEGTEWVQLRKCLTCGHVGCCDSSVGKHARKHFRESQHPIIESYVENGKEAPGKPWRWCYFDEMYLT